MIRIWSLYISAKSVLLTVLESILIALSLIGGAKLRFWRDPAAFQAYVAWPHFAAQAAVFIAILQICFFYNDLYNLRAVRSRSEVLIRLGQSLGAACLVSGLLYYLVPRLLIGRGVYFISMALVAASAALSKLVLDAAWRVTPTRNVVILGTGELAAAAARELMAREDLHLRVAGFVSQPTATPAADQAVSGPPVLGCVAQLDDIVSEHRISRIIVAIEDARGALPIQHLIRLRVLGVNVEDAYSVMAALTGRVWLPAVPSSWFVFSDGFSRSKPVVGLKRAVDILFALAGLVLSAPLMALVAVAVRLESAGPVLYRQVRVGWRGRPFELLKFRSMRQDAEDATGERWAQEDDPRVTRLGRFLRKYRLDELPQFLNVIRGQMSFVGPRPERPVFVEKLREVVPYFDERHSIRPGLTGWAQVNHPYCASVEDAIRKLEYDLFYLKNMSILFDCFIVMQTVGFVLLGRGGR